MSQKHQKLPPLPQSPVNNDSKVSNSLLTGSKAPLNQGESPRSPKKKKKFVHEVREKIEYDLKKIQN